MKVGYVRVSTQEQNTARQDVLMETLGVEKVFCDRMSGKDVNRPELYKMMEFVREGDIVVVESISRFARNTRDLLIPRSIATNHQSIKHKMGSKPKAIITEIIAIFTKFKWCKSGSITSCLSTCTALP